MQHLDKQCSGEGDQINLSIILTRQEEKPTGLFFSFAACVNGPSSAELDGPSAAPVPTMSSNSEQNSDMASAGTTVPTAADLTTPPVSRQVQPVTPASQPHHTVTQGPLPPG